MIGELTFQDATCSKPAYCIDLLGNLVRCSSAGPEQGLIPFAIELASAADELACPFPWTLTIDAVVERIALVSETQASTRAAYPRSKLETSAYPFVPHIEVTEDEQLILKAIELFPTLTGENAIAVREQLEAIGVFMIPAVDVFSPTIHEAAGDGLTVPPIKTVTAGWMSSMKVYRKALVRSA